MAMNCDQGYNFPPIYARIFQPTSKTWLMKGSGWVPCALCDFQEIVGDEEYFLVINMNYSCVFIFEISKFVLFFL